VVSTGAVIGTVSAVSVGASVGVEGENSGGLLTTGAVIATA
jgi:hypothetical protein|tara:strand:+ start:580 stop:702 length:123 start_codon:yes stop_codon:yes gene_type:complete